MATRTVRLDDEAEDALQEIRKRTGLPISEALKRGLRLLKKEIAVEPPRTAWDVYKTLDLGPGGYAIAPADNYKEALRDKLRKKHGR
jgi:hypothetical protein